jgi:protein AbiQ
LPPLFFASEKGLLQIYKISPEYLNFLRGFDPKVPNGYQGNKPFVGVIVPVDHHQYLAPLTSYKPKQDNIKSSQPTCVKLYELSNPDNKLGMIQLNNMVPILPSTVMLFDFEGQPGHYRSLLQRQYAYIRSVTEEIDEKAAKLYDLVVNKKHPLFTKLSCEFNTLEEKYVSYNSPDDLR